MGMHNFYFALKREKRGICWFCALSKSQISSPQENLYIARVSVICPKISIRGKNISPRISKVNLGLPQSK